MCRCDFDLPALTLELAELREQSAAPDLWNDTAHAQAVMKRVAKLEGVTGTWTTLAADLDDAEALLALAAEEAEEERAPLLAEAEEQVAALAARFADLEVGLTLSGPYDDHDAVIDVHAGAGGTEAQDWAEMLLRMYLRWAESHRMKTEILSLTGGEEAGIKSASVRIQGDNAYGLLRAERGVHRLVRISPRSPWSR
jgi:peptide chain release factor 2